MNEDIRFAETVATLVWFDVRAGLLCAEINSFVESIEFSQIAEENFESTTPIIKFSLGCQGSIVVCHHGDGKETWLPVDMWLPGGFTPLKHNDYQLEHAH